MTRNLFQSLLRHLDKKEFSIITGARQTGKSTLMRQVEMHCKNAEIPAVFLNLENQSILTDLDLSPLNVLAYLPQTEKKIVVFIDEIQYLQNPSNFLKLLFDEYADKLKIIATGSSAFYMDEAFTDSLAGRKKIFHLPTCSFDEYLKLNEKGDLLADIQRINANENAKSLKINILQQEWEQFILFGGYPAVITEPNKEDKKERLAEIRDSFVRKDVLEAGIKNEKEFYNLFRILASQTGNLLNVNELSLTLRIKNETVTKYLHVLQKCFHIVLVNPFSRNLRKELTKMPKVFLLDSGMQNSLLNNFQPLSLRADKGMIWENMCYKLLYEKYKTDDIFYWRTTSGNEVDFVLPYLEQPFAVEVKYDEALIKPSKYKSFSETYPEFPLRFDFFQPFNEDFFRRNL